jgi:hypothetical protein
MPLWWEIAGSQVIKKPNGHERVGVGAVKNILPIANLQSNVCDSSSSSEVVDIQLSPPDPPTNERAAPRSFDLNLPPPGEEDDGDERSPSLTPSWIGFSQTVSCQTKGLA